MQPKDPKRQAAGKARAKSLEPGERSAIAKKAAASRWAKELGLPKAIYGSKESPLTIGGVIWACFDLVKIANGEYCDGDGVALGSPVSWMVVLAWVVVGIYALTGVSILLAGCAGCAAAL